jgi:hypothetical protein
MRCLAQLAASALRMTQMDVQGADHQDLWRVQLASGELREMSLDDLDAAFEQGVLSARSPVLAPGASEWSSLGVVAGLADDEPAQESQVNSLTPFALSPTQDVGITPAPQVLPQDLADLDEQAFSPKKGRVIGFMVAGLCVLALGGVGLTRVVSSGAVKSAATGAQITGSLAQEPKADKPADEAAPSTKLSDDQKQKLIEADKAREAKQRAKAPVAAPGRKAPAGPRTKEGNPFHNGGDKYDPLNGAL